MSVSTDGIHEPTEADTYGTPHARKTGTDVQAAYWEGYEAAILDVEEAAENKHY